MITGGGLRVEATLSRREQSNAVRHPNAAAATAAAPVTLPISEPEVRLIASRGYPLWEPIEVMQLRNRRITLAYSDLSRRLAELVGPRPDGARHANWCTFATWSSRTIGASIEKEPAPVGLDLQGMSPTARKLVLAASAHLLGRGHGAIFRSLAAGNRFVFLEIGMAVARFLDAFTPEAARTEETWTAYWAALDGVLDELGQLDPSWVSTVEPDRRSLRSGLRCYFDAMVEQEDPERRAQLVLAGNLLVSAYEQQRVDGYLAVSLSLFTERAMRQLVLRHSGAFRDWYRRALSAAYAQVMTQYVLCLELRDAVLHIGRPLPVLAGATAEVPFPPELTVIREPLLQALLTTYDLSDGVPAKRRAYNWMWFAHRMNYITNLMRSRQNHQPLFAEPFAEAETAALLDGHLLAPATRRPEPGSVATP
jgi:hypothetical protein